MSVNPYLPQSTVVWAQDGALSALVCVHCGGEFDVPNWQPRMRCPHCNTLGYPDRSGRNLLSLDWRCMHCESINDGSINFCANCGEGLTSRCLRCEAPVYRAVCDRCGAPQSRMAHLQLTETERSTWVPALQEHIQQTQARQELEAERHFDPTYGVTEWRAIDRQMRRAVEARKQRHDRQRAHRQQQRGRFWGWLWLIVGMGWLVWANRARMMAYLQSVQVDALLTPFNAWRTTTVGPVVERTLSWLQQWWAAFSISLANSPDPGDPAYAYLFATAVFGLAVMPALIYLLGRLVRAIFP